MANQRVNVIGLGHTGLPTALMLSAYGADVIGTDSDQKIKEGYPYLFGSDAHNMTERRPDWDFLRRKVRESVLEEEVETLW